MRHLDHLVLKNGIFAGIVCATLIFALGWTGWVLSPLHQGRLRADKTVEYAVAMLNVDFDRAERTAQGLRALWRHQPVDLKDPSRIASIQPFLDHAGLVQTILLSRNGGETLFIVRTAKDWHLILLPDDQARPTVLRARDGKWVPAEPVPFERTFDSRERPWFKLASTSAAPAWTPLYAFTPGQDGYTYVIPVREGSRLDGVVGVDVTLGDLGRRIRELLPSPEYQVLVTDPGGRVLVPMPEGAGRNLDAPGPFGYGRRLTLRGQATPMGLQVAVAPGALVPGLRLRMWMVALAALLTFAAVMVYVHFLNRNLVRPIMRLLRQEASKAASSQIWEFRQLEESIRRLGQTEADRLQILQQLEHSQRVETMGNMAPGVIHDLNNHLSVILAQLNLCIEEGDSTANLRKRIGKAERATMRCAQAMRGLLEFSRPGQSAPVECHLNDLVQNAVTLLEPVLGETIQVETLLGEDLPLLLGEPVKLQQVLVNLALNARDAMRGCGILQFRTWREGEEACLEVRDTGSGMTEEVKRKLFDPFYTTKEPGKGTGLGLTMVQRIVTAHGGSIEVASELGEGTRFTIHLPVAEACAVGSEA